MSRMICYSLLTRASSPRPDLLWQLLLSVRSVRAHNATVSITVFLYGDEPDGLAYRLRGLDVNLMFQGSYDARLAGLHPRAWLVLRHYPLLHRFFNLGTIAAWNVDQVLLVDSDTLFFTDADEVFRTYSLWSCYAREEASCRRSRHGYDQRFIDERLLSDIAAAEGSRVPPPFNVGVLLLNNGLARVLSSMESLLVRYAWRLALWMAINPPTKDAAVYGEGLGIELLRSNWGSWTTEEDRASALIYPSANRWIMDEVALWLTLGHIDGFTYADFLHQHVLQNGEMLDGTSDSAQGAICHYFSQNTDRMMAWLSREAPWLLSSPEQERTVSQRGRVHEHKTSLLSNGQTTIITTRS